MRVVRSVRRLGHCRGGGGRRVVRVVREHAGIRAGQGCDADEQGLDTDMRGVNERTRLRSSSAGRHCPASTRDCSSQRAQATTQPCTRSTTFALRRRLGHAARPRTEGRSGSAIRHKTGTAPCAPAACAFAGPDTQTAASAALLLAAQASAASAASDQPRSAEPALSGPSAASQACVSLANRLIRPRRRHCATGPRKRSRIVCGLGERAETRRKRSTSLASAADFPHPRDIFELISSLEERLRGSPLHSSSLAPIHRAGCASPRPES